MTITLELGADVEAHLQEEAEKAGMPPDRYAERLLRLQLVPQAERIEHIIEYFDSVADPNVTLDDVSRDAIYAD